MKKDIKWLNNRLESLREEDMRLLKLYETGSVKENYFAGSLSAIDSILKYSRMVDQPEVLSQELPAIPKYVADWIEENKERYKNKFFGIGSDLYNNYIRLDVNDWIIENEEKFVRAFFYGYELEEEQIYYILDSKDIPLLEKVENQIQKTTSESSIHEEDRSNSRFKLTKQEIKGYDERFWAFAEPVEQADFRLLF